MHGGKGFIEPSLIDNIMQTYNSLLTYFERLVFNDGKWMAISTLERGLSVNYVRDKECAVVHLRSRFLHHG